MKLGEATEILKVMQLKTVTPNTLHRIIGSSWHKNNVALKELEQHGLVTKISGRYVITGKGRKMLQLLLFG